MGDTRLVTGVGFLSVLSGLKGTYARFTFTPGTGHDQSQCAHQTVALGVVVDQRGAVGDNSVVHGMPVAAELARDLVDARRALTHLSGGPPACSVAQRLS